MFYHDHAQTYSDHTSCSFVFRPLLNLFRDIDREQHGLQFNLNFGVRFLQLFFVMAVEDVDVLAEVQG